jgi:hypothetical protein
MRSLREFRGCLSSSGYVQLMGNAHGSATVKGGGFPGESGTEIGCEGVQVKKIPCPLKRTGERETRWV